MCPGRRLTQDCSPADSALSRALDWLGDALGSQTEPAHRTGVGVRDLAAAAGLTALDVVSRLRSQRAAKPQPAVVASVIVRKPRAEVYAFYRKLSQLPLVMDHLVSVREADAQWSHWVARVPTGTIAWDVKLADDVPGELIAWRSVKGSVIALRGKVTFADAPGSATEVRVELQLGAPMTRQGRVLAKLFSAPQLAADLRRLKLVLEDPEDLDAGSVEAMPVPAALTEGSRRVRAQASRHAP
jgi:uncharacterized membrane protein